MSYYPPPKELKAFPEARRVKSKTFVSGGGALRKRWKDGNFIYEWDSLHGRVEKYDYKGKHLGEFDFLTGEPLKKADSTRRIEP
jgi:hypothetical protein